MRLTLSFLALLTALMTGAHCLQGQTLFDAKAGPAAGQPQAGVTTVPQSMNPWGGDIHELQLTAGGAVGSAYRPDGKEFTRGFFELGVQRLRYMGGCFPVMTAQGLALEVAPGRQPVYGLRYGGWATLAVFGGGLYGIYYTDLLHSKFNIRFEMLLGGPWGRLALGLDLPAIRSRNFETGPSPGVHASLTFHLRMKRLKYDSQRQPTF